MIDKLPDNPDIAFLIVATVITTVITILMLLLRLFCKSCTILWKGTLISYIVFATFILLAWVYEQTPIGGMCLYDLAFRILSMILLVPGMLIYGLFPGVVKMCPSDFDKFALYTIGFLFYAIIFWGIMRIKKLGEKTEVAENKQGDIPEKQTAL